ncbi:MAG: DUF58 domain-containing protein [Bacteroidota bacterium]
MLRALYLSNTFFWILGGLVVLFVLSFAVPLLLPFVQGLLFLTMLGTIADAYFLFSTKKPIDGERLLPKLFSLADENRVKLRLKSEVTQWLHLSVIDELPVQFQIRDFERQFSLEAGEEKTIVYPLKPKERGEFHFGAINVYISSRLGLVQRRLILEQAQMIPVYPSIIQMKDYELKAFARTTTQRGIKKIRRIGHSYEFEQIKNYVRGDDYRSINWKASSRRGALMVNQYEDERAQQIYCLIDKSRAMRMPFDGLSLMDYAINSTLVISNIALRKYDRAGLITFSDKIGTSLKADSKPTQINTILRALYNEQERPLEANFELLYFAARKIITGRSLLLLFTNFESMYALERVLPILRRINRFHLLVVVFFENTEVRQFVGRDVHTMEDIYQQTVARQFLHEKQQMVQKLQQFGIQAVLTAPEDLSVNTINKYLELKSRGLI